MGWGWGEAQPFVRGRGAGLETPVSAVGASKAQEAPNRSCLSPTTFSRLPVPSLFLGVKKSLA